MNLRGKTWTVPDIESEIKDFGVQRVVNEHNILLYEFRKIYDLLHQANVAFVSSKYESYEINAKTLDELSSFIPKY